MSDTQNTDTDAKSARERLTASCRRKFIAAGGTESEWSAQENSIVSEALKAASLSEDLDDRLAKLRSSQNNYS